jgi:hypothetical protein
MLSLNWHGISGIMQAVIRDAARRDSSPDMEKGMKYAQS